jgi:biotin transport system substrate-specific component
MSEEYAGVDLVPDETVKRVAVAVLIAALTAVLAQLSIDLPGGIPFSLQPFGIFFAGLLLGPLWGGFALVLYLVTGLAGAPIFANGNAGLGAVAGPTGGFLVGFVIGAVVVGGVAHRRLAPRPITRVSPLQIAASLIAGLLVIYLVALPWFASVQGVSIESATVVMAPFAVGDLLKAAITVGIVEGNAVLLSRL